MVRAVLLVGYRSTFIPLESKQSPAIPVFQGVWQVLMICIAIYIYIFFFLSWGSFAGALCPISSLWFSCYWNMHFCRISLCYWTYESVFCLSVGDCKEQTCGNLLNIILQLNLQYFIISEQNFASKDHQMFNISLRMSFLTGVFPGSFWPIQGLPPWFYLLLVSSGFFSGLGFLTASPGSPWQDSAAYHFFLLTQLSLKFLLLFLPRAHYL